VGLCFETTFLPHQYLFAALPLRAEERAEYDRCHLWTTLEFS
jgi:hypothetical protein